MTGFLESVLLVSAVIASCAIAAPRVLHEGSTCPLKRSANRTGICKRLADCPLALENLQKHEIWPEVCKILEKQAAVVCCDSGAVKETTENTTTTTTTTAVAVAAATTVTTTTTTATTTANTGCKETSESSYNPLNLVPMKSEKKCREYSEWKEPPTLDMLAQKTSGACGIAGEQLIYGGKRANAMEFPHMAHLGFSKGGRISFQCGGSLISEKFILTAAHCLQDEHNVNVSHAKLGTGNNATTIVVKISRLIPHPDYKPEVKYNDVALLELETRLWEFNNFMRPACLHPSKKIDGEFGTATGWGVTEYQRKKSKELLKVSLPFVPFANCSKTFTSQLSLPKGLDDKSMLCAGGLDLKKDTCQGDSGGPLQIVRKTPNCMYSILGITSFGGSCGRTPGVYTRVSHYVRWIESIVWPDEQ